MFFMRGMPILYYGDEIMAQNNFAYAEQAAKAMNGVIDARLPGRGDLKRSAWDEARAAGNTTPEGMVFHGISRLIELRLAHLTLTEGKAPYEIETDKQNVVAMERALEGQSSILAVANLSGQETVVTIKTTRSGAQLTDLISGRNISFVRVAGGLQLKLKPYQYLWI
jgi:glycosidase